MKANLQAAKYARRNYAAVLCEAFHKHGKSLAVAQALAQKAYNYEYEVSLLEEQGMSRSDAQAVVDLKEVS